MYEEVYNKALAEEKERQKVFGDYEATQFEFALYGEFNEIKDNREESISLTKKIYSQMVKETEIVGWRTKISVEKNMKTILYEELSAAGFTDEKLEELSEKILTLAKNKL